MAFFCYLSSCFNPQSRPVGAAFFCLSPLYQSSAVESTVSPEPSGLAAEDFFSSEGDFTYLELEYGTPAQVVLPLFGLSGEDLRAQLGSLYGLPEEESVLEDVLAPAQEERGKDLLYDVQRFSSVVEKEGERATRLFLSLMELDGAGVQLELSLALYQ